MLTRLVPRLTDAEADPGDIPTPASVSPRLREIEAQADRLKARLAELKAEHAASVAAMRESAKDKAARHAGELLAGRPKETHRPAPEIDGDMRAVEEAIEELRQSIITETLTASATIRKQIAPRHAELVADMADKILALRDAVVEYVRFADELNAKGIAWSALRPMHPSFLGSPTDKHSEVAMWLREAEQYGFIARETIPEDLRYG